MKPKNETPILLLTLSITLVLLGSCLWWLSQHIPQLRCLVDSSGCQASTDNSISSSSKGMSLGDEMMIPADKTAAKEAGIKAFQQKNYTEAIAQFQTSLNIQKNDPETLIYLNNAKATNGNPLKIATVVPIGGNLNVAKEILRGVAQAQNEINNKGGIQGRLLQVIVANDNNKPDLAKEVANKLIEDESILAVVGHNSSEASLAAAPEYQKGNLVMISPTSKTKELPDVGDYIFRTVPSFRLEGDLLVNYTVNKLSKKKIAICDDSQAAYSQSLKSDLLAAIQQNGGTIIDTACDFSDSNFDANASISDIISKGGETILLAPSVNKLTTAIDLAKANQKKLTLLGSSTLYTFQTLQEGGGDANGLIIAVPWHPDSISSNSFSMNAKRTWGGEVNWRTALAYDATTVIISALYKNNSSRQEIQKTLANADFSVDGATGKIQFLPSGDRKGAVMLVRVVPGKKSGTGFDFKMLTTK
jgi:branched-chain amino acid transport system substrate-binding protein